MSESLLTMAKDLALAQITAGHATPDSLTELLNSTSAFPGEPFRRSD
jgi:hypothetical protein